MVLFQSPLLDNETSNISLSLSIDKDFPHLPLSLCEIDHFILNKKVGTQEVKCATMMNS